MSSKSQVKGKSASFNFDLKQVLNGCLSSDQKSPMIASFWQRQKAEEKLQVRANLNPDS